MLQQLLWIEVLLKGLPGLLLVLAPGHVSAAVGLPAAGNGLWPRLFGGLLLGLTAALLIQGSFPAVRTLTPAGLVTINLTAAAALLVALVLGKASETRRGTVLLWGLAAALALLSLFEIAHA